MVVFVGLLAAAGSAWAAGQVEVTLVTDRNVSLTAQQDWARGLGQLGLTNVRLRSKQPADQPAVEKHGTENAPIYAVTGVIVSDDVLQVPGRRFKRSDLTAFRRWLDDLVQQGPEEQRPVKVAFGLDAQQLQLVQNDLGQSLGFSTEGVSRPEAIEKIARQLRYRLKLDGQKLAMGDEDKISEELSRLTCGTALAYLLRPLGLCLVPQGAAGGVEYAVMASAADLKAWPVGWEPEKPERELAPGLYEFLNVNVQGVAVTEVLKAVNKRLELPVLWDYSALARHGVEPAKTAVTLPKSRTTYSLMLRKVLFQAKLKSEIRVDEAGKPILWVTTVKPL
jgi:hypothetical protein